MRRIPPNVGETPLLSWRSPQILQGSQIKRKNVTEKTGENQRIHTRSLTGDIGTTRLASLLQRCIEKRAHLAGKATHAEILVAGFSHDTFLSNRLVELYARCNRLDEASNVFNSMPRRNTFSWNAIISACSKSSNLDLAHYLFEQMPDKNVVSWNTIISASAWNGLERKALDLYHAMVREGFVPTNFTFASILSSCGSLNCLDDGTRCHGLALKIGLDANLFVENALVGMYAKCGRINDAVKLFDDMSHPNEVSFTAVMSGLVQSNSIQEALKLFGKMHRCGIFIDPVAISSVLGACARAGEGESSDTNQNHRLDGNLIGQSVQALVIKHGFESDSHLGNSLIDMYAKHGDMEKAEMVFNTLPVISVVSWNVLITGYGQKGDSKKAIYILQLMQQSGFEPDEVSYIGMLGACVKSRDIIVARKMFDKILSPSVTSWNAILSGYCQEESYKEAIELFRKMQFIGVRPDRTTLALILSSCSGIGLLDFGKQVHAASTRAMLHVDMFVASGLVDMYSKCGYIELAKQVFDRMPERDIVCWNSMITAFALHPVGNEALAFFKQMRENGMFPTEFSYASVINSCSRHSSLPQGRQIHALVAKDGYDADVYVGSALIDMYAKCGNVDEARRFFDSMSGKNIVSWNEMIHGYAQNGCGERAVELFEYMLTTDEKPNGVTFIAVLTACSHSGLVDVGLRFFESMEKEHGIMPLADHYTCVVDALGRSGRLMEAEALVYKMPCKDDPIIWEVLLSACAVHGNADLGKHAAEQLFRIDPRNSAPYVLLSNIYAALGRWSDVAVVRAMMSDRGVVKDRGYSWIGYKGGVRVFMVDDDLEMMDGDVKALDDGIHTTHGAMQIGKRYKVCAA